ncbi:MAG: class I SAM-dependent methyltransferase [Candidatus Bathyarchaeota archaeon]|nr:MAG: class I SAM-dependent methyltransferase [Candidatus Bathyarchaeota archaeon]
MQFEKDYFSDRRYKLKEKLVKRHVLEVVKWASKVSNSSLFNGQGKKALDVGCAYGYASKILETLGYETYGVDLSKWGVKRAKMNSDGYFLVCDAQTNFPFRAMTFDLITCFEVLEHLQFPEKAIQNMLEICEGAVICTTPNKAVEKPVRKIMRDFDETHINVKFSSEWEKCIKDTLDYKLLKIETFYDFTAKIADRLLFFKSFKVPNFGLTVRILVRK